MRRTKSKPLRSHAKHNKPEPPSKSPFIEHLHELRRRLMYVAFSVLAFGGAAYAIEQPIIHALLRPAHGEQFIYTSPGGGIDFLFRVCVYAGVVVSIPVIVYQILKYLEPLIKKDSMRFIMWGSVVSGILAFAGVIFGYFVGLPAALHFLSHQFTTSQIKPLVTIQSYMSFVSFYMFGSALLFQLPLWLIFINRIKPLKPSGLFKKERWVILGAFVMSGLMNPTPNLMDQLMLAGPIIIMYQIGIAIIWFVNRKTRSARPKEFSDLLAEDEKARSQRINQFAQARTQIQNAAPRQMQTAKVVSHIPVRPAPAHDFMKPAQPAVAVARVIVQNPTVVATPKTTAKPQGQARTVTSRPHRPVQRRYISDFSVRRPNTDGMQRPNTVRPQPDQGFA